MKMKLGDRQALFSISIAKLIIRAYELGYEIRCGDFWAKPRNPLEHKKHSEHYDRCAGDLNLFLKGVYLKETKDHAELGAYWESLHPNCRWGGRYSDGNHYEVIEETKA